MSKKKSLIRTIIDNKFRYLAYMVVVLLFIFLRFYQLEERMQFSWDQVDNAWVSKNLIVNHVLPIYGMPVNQGSGFNIGPLYYYIIAGAYYLFNLDPVGAGIFAGLTSFITFIVIFIIVMKVFNRSVAFFAAIIYLFSNYVILFDRISWPVNFIPLISILLFYFLFKAITDNKKYLLLVACVLGFSFHIHFTSVLYLVILLFSLPYFLNKNGLVYSTLSLLVFGVWVSPIIVADTLVKAQAKNISGFFGNTFHGFHARRMLQIAADAFIEFPGILGDGFLKFAYLFVPFFIIIYLHKNKEWFTLLKKNNKPFNIKKVKDIVTRKEFVLIYLMFLWFVIPWVALSTYSGNISNYYFSLTRPIAVTIIAYVLFYVFSLRNVVFKLLIFVFFAYFIYINLSLFLNYKTQGLAYFRRNAKEEVDRGIKNQFLYGAPESYLHYFYERNIK